MKGRTNEPSGGLPHFASLLILILAVGARLQCSISHEGNFGMVGLLAGMRKAERDFAERKGPHPATLCTGGCGSGIEDADDADPLQ